MEAIEPMVREFCARSLDPFMGSGGFDFIRDLGAQMPMRTIGFLLGVPEQDQEAIRDRIDETLKVEEGTQGGLVEDENLNILSSMFEDYVDWRAQHPSDDLMTELLNAEFEDDEGVHRKLTRDEVLTYVTMLAGAGNETTTRLIGWTGQLLAEHPEQLRMVAEDRSLIPNAIEEVLRYEAPSPVQARYVNADVQHYGQTIPEGSVMVLLNGSANRDDRQIPDGERFDLSRRMRPNLSFGYGIHFCLGAALARLEGRVALDEVLHRFPEWKVDNDRAVQSRTSTVRGWQSLPVITS
jgi:cytochrome P450